MCRPTLVRIVRSDASGISHMFAAARLAFVHLTWNALCYYARAVCLEKFGTCLAVRAQAHPPHSGRAVGGRARSGHFLEGTRSACRCFRLHGSFAACPAAGRCLWAPPCLREAALAQAVVAQSCQQCAHCHGYARGVANAVGGRLRG